jgi:hypothetical protein
MKLQLLLDEVRNIANERPDVTYQNEDCMYDTGKCSDGTVGCLIGQALTRLDIDPAFLDRGSDTPDIASIIDREIYFEDCDDTNISWLANVQSYQDEGLSWREAIRLSDEHLLEDNDE